MPFESLGAFLRHLARHGELHTVRAPVSPEYEIGEIAQRAVREGKPALLFTNVEGSSIPVAMNALATRRRIEWAIGRAPESVGEEIVATLERLKPPTWAGLWASRVTLGRALRARVVRGGRAPSQKVREPADLSRLPVLRCWPED